jgi:hypothetical protein
MIAGGLGCDLFHHPADNLAAELGRIGVQNLAHYSLHYWFDPAALLHACSEVKFFGGRRA